MTSRDEVAPLTPSMWDITEWRRHLARLVCGYCGRGALVTPRGNVELLYCCCSAGQRGAGEWIAREQWVSKHGDTIVDTGKIRGPRYVTEEEKDAGLAAREALNEVLAKTKEIQKARTRAKQPPAKGRGKASGRGSARTRA